MRNTRAGVPAQADIIAYGSLAGLLESAFRRFPQRDAPRCFGARPKYRELDELSLSLSALLQSPSLAPGARAAVMMPNVPQYLVAMAGILRTGLVVGNVNPLYTPRGLLHRLKDSGAEAIVVLENFAQVLE